MTNTDPTNTDPNANPDIPGDAEQPSGTDTPGQVQPPADTTTTGGARGPAPITPPAPEQSPPGHPNDQTSVRPEGEDQTAGGTEDQAYRPDRPATDR